MKEIFVTAGALLLGCLNVLFIAFSLAGNRHYNSMVSSRILRVFLDGCIISNLGKSSLDNVLMAHLSIDVLGTLQVSIAGKRVTQLESVKFRALLAYLVVEANRPHRRESLVGLLWPDFPEESARHNLRQALFKLREALNDPSADPPFLLITRDTIQFNQQSDYSLDIERFNHYFFSCKDNLAPCNQDSSIYASNLEEMIKLYRGEFLQQLMVNDSAEFEDWLLVQRENYHQRVLEAHSYLANYYDERVDFHNEQRHASRQLELDPWREEAHRQLMRALALGGQRSAALVQYETCKRILAEELDVEPAAETRALYEQIKLGTLTSNKVPPAAMPFMAINNLPHQLTPFVGRESELVQLGEYLTNPDCRCLTLVGTGGIGKTRLAVQAARNQLGFFTHGIAFVSMASAESIQGIIPALANAINFSFLGPGDPQPYLLDYLKEKHMLLILDNIEHLLIGDEQNHELTGLIIDILHSAPLIKLLVTSREILNIQEEWIFEVRGLDIPPAVDAEDMEKFDAISLFIQRARRTYPRFVLDEENRADVARVCRLVEGMPLAIELAATWMRILSPADIANEIEKSLDFLSTSMRDLPERHRSVRVVFDQSWQMLSPEEQRVLRKLSVFQGGFQRQATEQVAGASLSILSTLLSRTLLRRTTSGRYDMQELVRQYCTSHLEANPQEKADTQKQHFAFYLTMAETASQEIQGSNQLEWLSRLELDHDNLRVGLKWALENELQDGDELGLRLSSALRWFWRMRGHFHEGCNWLIETLKQYPETRSLARASALLGLSLLKNGLGDLDAALPLAVECVGIFQELGDRRCLAEASLIEGLTLLWQGEASQGRSRIEEALSLYRQVGDPWGEANALYRLGSSLADYGGDPAGRLMLEQSAAILEELHEKYLYTSVMISLGIVDLGLGNYDAAQLIIERGLMAAREIRHPWGIADALSNLGGVHRIQGDYVQAQLYLEEALEVYHTQGQNIWETDALCALAENALVQGDFAAARKRLQAASRVLGNFQNAWLRLLLLYFQGLLAFYENNGHKTVELLEETVKLARAGQFMPDLARSLVTLGNARIRSGELEIANQLICEGLELFKKLGHKLGMITALEAIAALDAARENYGPAVKSLAAAQSYRRVLGAPLPPVDRIACEALVSRIRSGLGEAEFSQQWGKHTVLPFEEIIEGVDKLCGQA
jgi:DNA-binding SARP family transcriptional activator/tetratricopeptide (TPR) repeat protein